MLKTREIGFQQIVVGCLLGDTNLVVLCIFCMLCTADGEEEGREKQAAQAYLGSTLGVAVVTESIF